MGVQDDIMSVIAGPSRTQPKPPQAQGAVEGVIISVSSRGAIFTIPDYDNGVFRYGPAKWCNGGAPPAVGADCLVLFVGVGINNPWILAWWGGTVGFTADGGTP